MAELPLAGGRAEHPELAGEDEAVSDLLLALAAAPSRDPASLVPLAPGARVGRFELLREVGRGGFGLVFEARDTELGRRVAFKAMKQSRLSGSALEKPLREEAEAAARLNHPNVVTLHDYGLHQGTPYLILELLEGETLHRRLAKGGPLAPEEALRIARQVARGLVHAHAHGVLHRDLKPGNVFLTADGGVKLLDFGLARLLDRASLAGGTPAYMAPEQLRGEPGDVRADVFAAGVLLFQMLTGALPYPVVKGKSAALEPGPPPSLPIADPPAELATLVARALARDPADRPQTAADLLQALDGVERAYAARELALARAGRRRRLRRLVVAASALALGGAIWATLAAAGARAQADRALRAARIVSAAEGASDPLIAVLLMAELGDDPSPRALEVAQRILREPVPVAVLEPVRGGGGLALSPDGERAAAGAADGGATVWPADGAGAPVLLVGGGERTNDVAFTPDGARLVTAAMDGQVRVFPAAGGPPTVVVAGAAPLVRLSLSPDGRRGAVGALDGRAWLFPLDGGRPAEPLLHDGAVFAVAFSPDGARLATGGADGWLRLFDGRTGALLARVPVPGGALFALAWAPDGARLALASEDGLARVATAGGALTGAFGAPGEALADVAFSPDGTRLVAAGGDGMARVHTLGGGPEVLLRGHRGAAVFTAAFSRDGARVLTAASDGTARLWRADGEGPPIVFRGPTSGRALLSADGRRLVSRSKDAVRVFRADDPAERGILRGHGGLVDTVAWSRDGSRLVTSSHDGTARVWPLRGGAPLVVRDPGHGLHSAALSPDERLLLTASQDGRVRLWEAAGGAPVRALEGHDGPALSAAFSPDGQRIASVGIDRTVRLWSVEGGPGAVLGAHDGVVTTVGFTRDGRFVVSASEYDASVRLWPVTGGEPRVLRLENGVFRATPTPDGARLLVPEGGGALRSFALDTLAELPAFPALPEGLFTAAESPDGALVALGSTDGTVRIFTRDGRPDPLVLRGHLGGVGDLAWSPDGTELATASADGTARVWSVSWDRTLALLRDATTACLPVRHRVQVLGERPAEAEQRAEACQRAHGRVSPALPGGGAPPAAAVQAPAGAPRGG